MPQLLIGIGVCVAIAAIALIPLAYLAITEDPSASERDATKRSPAGLTDGRAGTTLESAAVDEPNPLKSEADIMPTAVATPEAEVAAQVADHVPARESANERRATEYGRELSRLAPRVLGGIQYAAPRVDVENIDQLSFEVSVTPEDRVTEHLRSRDWACLVCELLGIALPVRADLPNTESATETDQEGSQRDLACVQLQRVGTPADVLDRAAEALARRPYVVHLRYDGPPVAQICYEDAQQTVRVLGENYLDRRDDELRIRWDRAYGNRLILSFDKPAATADNSPGSASEAPGDFWGPARRPPVRTLDSLLANEGNEPPDAYLQALFASCFQPKVQLSESLSDGRDVPEFEVVPQGNAVRYKELIDTEDWDGLARLATGRSASQLQLADWERVKQQVSLSRYNIVLPLPTPQTQVYSLRSCLAVAPEIGWNKSCLDGSHFIENPAGSARVATLPVPATTRRIGGKTYVAWSDQLGGLYLSDRSVDPLHRQRWSGYATRAARMVQSYRDNRVDRSGLEQALRELHQQLHAEQIDLLIGGDASGSATAAGRANEPPATMDLG